MGATVTTRNVVMIGLDGAGKTQLLYTLKLNDDPGRFEPTSSMNFERLVVIQRPVRYILNIWDLPGSLELRPMWRLFWGWTNVETCVWVMHANDRTKFDENLNLLSQVCQDDGLRFSEFIVVLNIQDTNDIQRIKPEEFTQRVLGMPTIARRIQDQDMKVIELNAKDRKDLSGFKDMLCVQRDLLGEETKLTNLGFVPVISE
jgi:small GTP-binding protein|tara:strand:+ start:58 stop:663 length:606 start_codon:yes stop_codon:yes gene_type:complete